MTFRQRTTSRIRGLAALALCLAAAAVVCAGASGGAGTVLRVPFLTDISVPDPDVFYDTEGNSVILSLYEGLLRYAPDSTKIVPSLARSYTVSRDGRTYTFTLRAGVRFHDGSPLTAAAVKASFERRVHVDAAPAYMLGEVARIATPNVHTVVVTLKQPVGPFLNYLASSWGPKIIGPAALEAHAGSDFGQKYLQTHDDGTGPYVLGALDRGRQYTLTRFDGYWGAKPFFQTVLIKIVPDVGTQRLQLESGDLDAILHAFPAAELKGLGDSVQVQQKPTLLRSLLYLNPNKAPFSSAVARAAVADALDVRTIVQEVYSGTARPAAGPYQPQILSRQPALGYRNDPAAARSLVAEAGGPRNVTLGFSADDPPNKRTAELIQVQLAKVGYDVTLKEVPVAQLYDYIDHPKAGPDMLVGTYAPDAAHPDAWARIVWRTGGGLDLLGYSDKAVDRMIDRASLLTGAAADALYRKIGGRIVASHAFLSLADVDDVFLLRKDLVARDHVPAYPWLLDYAAARRAG